MLLLHAVVVIPYGCPAVGNVCALQEHSCRKKSKQQRNSISKHVINLNLNLFDIKSLGTPYSLVESLACIKDENIFKTSMS